MRILQSFLMRASDAKHSSEASLIKRRPFLKQGLLKSGCVVCCFCLACVIVITYTHLGECASDSLGSFKYALFLKTSSFNRGDIVLIRNHVPKYRGKNHPREIAFAKRILGMPGDLLTRDKEGLYVTCHAQKEKPLDLAALSSQRDVVNDLGEIQSLETHSREVNPGIKSRETQSRGIQSRETESLPVLEKTKDGKPLTPLRADIVPEGYVFVAGDHLRSFDSRYEEFGLVSNENIWGKALFTW